MRKFALIFLISIVAIIAAACGSNSESTSGSEKETKAEEITVKHQLGETKVKKNPENVVVFDFGVLDSLDKLGVEVAGLPQDNLPKYLEKYADKKYQNAGGIKEPDFEKINEMAPDLIIISGRQQEAYEDLSEIAPTIFMGVDTARYMESYEENAKTLGEIFGKESEVETELAKVKETIDGLKEKTSTLDKNSLVILANEGNISAYGPGSRFGLIHDVFGLKAVDENLEVSTHGQNISFEYLVEKDPDYLFIVDRGAVVEGGQTSGKSIVENELVKNIKAVKENQVIYLNPDYWYLSGGGLTSVAEMVKEVEAGIEK
ncbi:siderophore ABC transporter substrate-binding protein [Mesobacillus foraminis]|uniref:Iron complex transport system substrate-binding protein n=1 Tax=Mesobacillus foraminis TaxID=279826 RepID=A0A4R2BL38_9BACI|nr:siderophore ABC transporter substrate-binding protein [Mesobacillus foraminis]TCN27766.1 iron complex transport system substrate-binding protein [Mesobacillus foraminis]